MKITNHAQALMPKVYFMMVISFILALMLTVMGVWSRLQIISPAWVVMVCYYWMLRYPSKIQLATAWCLGAVLDIALLTPLGMHALALLCVAFAVMVCMNFLKSLGVFQHALVVCLLVLGYEVILQTLAAIMQQGVVLKAIWMQVILSALIWPLVAILLKLCQPLIGRQTQSW